MAAALLLGSEFLPKLDEGALWVRATFPGSISPSEAARLTRKIRTTLASFPEVRTVVSQLGRPDDGTDVNGFDTVELYVDLLPRERWTTAKTRDGLSEAMNAKLAAIPGIELTFSQVIEDNVNEAVSGIKSELSVKIFGEDPAVLQDLADRTAAVLDGVPGAADVAAERLAGQPQVQISVDRPAIGRYGLSVSDVQTVIETALSGAVATQILEGEKTFDLVVRVDPGAVTGLDSIRGIPILGPSGEKLTLGCVPTCASPRLGAGLPRGELAAHRRKLSVAGATSVRSSRRPRKGRRGSHPARLPPEWTGAFENQRSGR